MQEEFILRQVNIEQDAEKLAVMWNESDDQWPGTWTGGVPMTAQSVREWYEREKKLAVYVFETGDRSAIAGYCSFCEQEEEKGTVYVGLLNVHPAYQGKSLGRRLLQRCIQDCMQLGFRRLDLETWSGNLKSVPLYKKVGLFWVPDTSVYMMNFVPSILGLPCAQPYFAKHDWYRTFQRELTQAEDQEVWQGLKVFTYRWQADGDMLTVWADREARTLTGVETNDFFAAALPDNIEPAKGLSTTIRWQLRNKSQKPLSVSLIASGTEHLKLDHRATLTVAPGETAELEAEVEVAADAPAVKKHKPVPAVRTLLIIDGQVLELGSGLRPQPAVDVTLAPQHVTLFPGVAKTVYLQLQSHLRQDVTATVSLTPAPGLQVDWTERAVPVQAKNFAGLPITLQADRSGVYPLRATVYFDQAKTLPKRLALFCLPAGGVLADRDSQEKSAEARIENEAIRVIIAPKEGGMSIYTKQDNERIGWTGEQVGPPFWPSELDDKEYHITLQQENGAVKAVLTADLDTYPGITLRREVTVGGGGLIEIDHQLINNGTETHTVQVSKAIYRMQRDGATITMPLAGGIVHSHRTEFPTAEEDAGKKPQDFAERWIAIRCHENTLGILWEESIVENEFGWGLSLLTPRLECKPQQRTQFGRHYLYAGPGDWRTVRQQYRRLAGSDHRPEPIPARARRVFDIRLEPAPLVAIDDQVAARLVADNLRGRPLQGPVQFTWPQGVTASEDQWTLGGVKRDNSIQKEVTLTLDPGAAAYEGHLHLQGRLFDTDLALPIIRLGTRDRVQVERGKQGKYETYRIDNGRTRWTVAPGFTGAMVGWEEDGINHLLCPFPEQKTFGWMSPWYGGLTPLALREEGFDFPGKLYQETLTAEIVDLPDERGIPWRGVRVSAQLQRERLLGLTVQVDYLTVGHSNVLKVIYRVRNATTAQRLLGSGLLSFWQPDGDSPANVLHSADRERKHTAWEAWISAENWGTVSNPATGRTVALVSPTPDVRLIDWGDAGGHLGWLYQTRVDPQATCERVCYLALCKDMQEAKRYICLKDYL